MSAIAVSAQKVQNVKVKDIEKSLVKISESVYVSKYEVSNKLYGMFLSIFVPPSKKDKGILFCVLISCLVSCTIFYLPQLRFISSGFAIIISAIVSSVVISLVFPRNED